MISNVGKIKEIIAGDSMTENRKHQDAIDFEPTAKHIFAANQLPEARVDDDAFFDRWLLVKMPYSIPPEEQDRDLINKIEDELPELLNWALEGLERLEEQEGFTGDRNREDTAELWRKWSSSVKMFSGEMLEKTTDGEDIISKDHLAQVFERYCEVKGMPSATKQTITQTITAEAGVNHDTYHPEHSSGVYRGVTWSERGLKMFRHVVMEDGEFSSEDIEEMLAV
jgi:putative DNA primase/helicase